MSIVVTSTPNTEVAQAPKAEAKPEEVVEQKESAEAPEASETTDESETLEAKEGDEDTEAEEDEESEEIKDEEAKEDKPKGKGIQKRIGKLTKRASAAEQERDYWKQVALDKQNSEPKKESAVAKKTETAGKPKAEDFETHDEYVEALSDWKVEQKLTQHEAKQKEAQVKTEHQSRIAKHVERVKAFAEKHEDFDEALEDVNDVNMSLTVQECILGSENGPELMYALAKDRKEYERICALPAIAAARELGKFEARLAKPQPQKTKASKAPSPIKPVGQKSSGGAKKSLSDPNLSQAEFERIVMEQAKQKSAWG